MQTTTKLTPKRALIIALIFVKGEVNEIEFNKIKEEKNEETAMEMVLDFILAQISGSSILDLDKEITLEILEESQQLQIFSELHSIPKEELVTLMLMVLKRNQSKQSFFTKEDVDAYID